MVDLMHLIAQARPWLNPWGLFFDFVGVILLGVDLIRVQRSMKRQAKDDLTRFNAMVDEHGGAEDWIKFISQGTNWIDVNEILSKQVAEDEPSKTIRNTKVKLGEALKVIATLSEATTKLISFQNEQAQSNTSAANASLAFSATGLLMICIGFALQCVPLFIRFAVTYHHDREPT
jgi:hypothetical protein